MSEELLEQEQQELDEKRGSGSRYKSFWELDEQDKFNLFRAIGLVANFRRKSLGSLSLDSAVVLLMTSIMKMESDPMMVSYIAECSGLKSDNMIKALSELGVVVEKIRGGYSIKKKKEEERLIECKEGVVKDFLEAEIDLSERGLKFIEEISRMAIFS